MWKTVKQTSEGYTLEWFKDEGWVLWNEEERHTLVTHDLIQAQMKTEDHIPPIIWEKLCSIVKTTRHSNQTYTLTRHGDFWYLYKKGELLPVSHLCLPHSVSVESWANNLIRNK